MPVGYSSTGISLFQCIIFKPVSVSYIQAKRPFCKYIMCVWVLKIRIKQA